MALTDIRIKSTKTPCKLSDTNGLYLEVRPNGNKLWRYRYRIGGKENVFAIGEYPTIGLADARAERVKARELVKQGIHPAHNRKSALVEQLTENDNTFKVLAEEWLTSKKKGWSKTYAKQVERVLTTHAYPYVGTLPVRTITSAHMLCVLERIEKKGILKIAQLVCQCCSAVFCYAIGRRKTDTDPMYALRRTIKCHAPKHYKPLPQKEIPIFLRKLDEYNGHPETYIAMRVLMLTFVRTGELRGATWEEFDLDNAVWRIPASRMKMKKEHIVPLSTQVVELLEQLHSLTGYQKWLFPNIRRPLDCMAASTINNVIATMGYAGEFSAHGFRSTASTLLNEMGYSPDVIERQLAHAPQDKIRASYNHAQYLQERRKMMQNWADYLDGLKAGAKIIPIKQAA